MATSLLERTRALHEDLERLERIIVKDLSEEAKSHKEKLMQNHRVRKRLDQMQDTAGTLVAIYHDEDRSRREDIEAIGAPNPTAAFGKFYERLKEVRGYHARTGGMYEVAEKEDDEALLKEEVQVVFTGEEMLGRYLDLHEHHQAFVNSKSFGRKVDYFTYIGTFADFASVPKRGKMNAGYRQYLDGLLAYLVSFYERTQPLVQLGKQLKKIEDEFSARWQSGVVPGWGDRGRGADALPAGAVDLDAFDSVEELEALGGERLKEACKAVGLKCGGTPRQRAERLFSTRGVPAEKLDKNLFAAGEAPAASLSEEEAAKAEKIASAVALLEAKVSKLAEVLANVVSDTRARVEKKQAQTYEEMQAELEEAEAELEQDSDEEDEYIYNPLQLPPGWDGKPIPYWLYKLHGLNQEFRCEICGDGVYYGRRAYEKHFKEWKHQNGMRRLGIPNTKMFFEVTKIDDARELWRVIQERQRGGWAVEQDEELEDAEGNVYNRKTYEDLKRQGLL